MSLRVVGGAGTRQAQVDSYTVPATITSNTNVSVTSNVPVAPTPVVTNVVTTSTKTSYKDNPGMSSLSVKTFTSPGQVDALRSAAANTALAFGLNITISSDRALRLQNQVFQESLSVVPIIVDTVVIPD